MIKLKQNLIMLFFVLFVSLSLVSCGSSGITESVSTQKKTSEYVPNKDMLNKPYLILAVDMTTQQMMLKDTVNGRQLLYSYNLGTVFCDKYGGLISVTGFTPGKVCAIDEMDGNGLVSSMHLSDYVWEYEDVENYSIDTEREVFTIGTTNYHIPGDVPVFSNNIQTDLTSLGENDILRLTGKDKEIWSVTVTTGHGLLSIVNTQAFDGSLICIGDIYTLINGDMSIEVPEGTYNITVANNGYGGSAQVEVLRGGQVTLDLETIKSTEQRFCHLTFNIEVPDAVIKLDGNVINKDEAFDIAYGRHVLSVIAPGYESWSKYLYVNSPTATIMLTMEEEGKSNTPQKQETVKETETDSDSTKTDNKDKDSTNKQQVELEYLTTIRDTISSIMSGLTTP